MSICFHKSLHDLMSLPVDRLHGRSLYSRGELGRAEWKMGLCLLAWQKRGDFETMGFSSVTEYAERALQLSGQKMAILLATARALQHLPLVSEAYRRGEICWSKIRAMQSLLTPDTEHLWLKYARMFRSDQVARKVGLCPNAWKRQKALAAALANKPIASPEEVARLLDAPWPPASKKASGDADYSRREGGPSSGVSELAPHALALPFPGEPAAPDGEPQQVTTTLLDRDEAGSCLPGSSEQIRASSRVGASAPAPPFSPRVIRLTIEMTPDQFAMLESAQQLLKARAGKRMTQGEMVARMAEEVLNRAPSRTRVKHMVVVHATPGSEQAWYETSRGILPVSPEILRKATDAAQKARERAGSTSTTSPTGIGQTVAGSEMTSPAGIVEAIAGGETSGTAAPCDETPCDSELGVRARNATASQEARPAPGVATPPNRGLRERASSSVRQSIPAPILRALRERSAGRCERCGSRGPLQVHHTDRVSEGGGNSLERLEDLCWACHGGEHRKEFEQNPYWRAARGIAMSRAPT